jgi:hypothetical protein
MTASSDVFDARASLRMIFASGILSSLLKSLMTRITRFGLGLDS